MSDNSPSNNEHYMEKMYSELIDSLHTIATPDDVLLQFDGEPDTTTILDAVWLRIKKMTPGEKLAALDGNFFRHLRTEEREKMRVQAQKEKEFQDI